MPKTIFITSFHTLISRNILQTDLLNLLAKDNKVVILAPDFKKQYFIDNFSGGNIIIEGVNTRLKRKDIFFRKLALSLSPTKTLYIKKRAKFFEDRKFFSFLASVLPSFTLGRFKIFLKFFRYLDFIFLRPEKFLQILKKYKPDLVFATDIMLELDVRLLEEAKKMKIKTLAMVRSWDNLTTKGVLRIFPDTLVVQNDLIKREAVYYNNFPENKISVVGMPHYDRYAAGPISSKEKFFKKFNFDSNKKLILIAPAGNRYIRNNNTDKFIAEVLSGLDLNILIRIPPGDVSDFHGFKSKKAKVAFDYSGVHTWKGGRKTNEISKDDDNRLIDSLYFANAVVAHLATMCIDAAFFNKPIVVIGFDPEKREYLDSIERYFDYEHLAPIIKSGGIKIARNKSELLSLVGIYLDNPALDYKGRKRIVENQVRFLDGKSTLRLAGIIQKELPRDAAPK